MPQLIVRKLYRALLRLHPECFRASFAPEMMRVFDEAWIEYGAAWLLGDAALSLLRQWCLRSPEDAQLAGPDARFGLLAGSYPVGGPPHLTMAKLSAALLLTLTSFLLFPYPGAYVPGRMAGRAHVQRGVRYVAQRNLSERP
ncbi:hypothetical protein SAMN05421770_11025 [Granulicella rosea]|uniref:Uncharacterized protein n=1 Tax=Granulicella rosea TaxID=474952 RepID=A0A239M5P4_9BACT|nr:hypothetical protein [Granulicella rosea]SNT38035.1 hypothetical protein SAMN05421770_11025 [Granulicella rosea]